MLSHGQRITTKEIETTTSSWSPSEFASLCNATVWASARRQGAILPSFTERVYVKDRGIDAWYLALGSEIRGTSHLISTGLNILQYKLRDVFAQNRSKIVSGLKDELKRTKSENQQSEKGYEGALKDVYERTGQRPSHYTLFTNIDLTLAQKDALKTVILKGYDQPDNVQVVVNGAADLAALLNDLPHLRSAYFVPSRFNPWERAWATHTREKLVKTSVALVGRVNELVKMKACLDDPAIQAVIVTGLTGTGKSRLALEATQHCQTDTIVALDPTSISVSDLLAAVSPGASTIMIIEDPDPVKADEFVRQALGHPELKLVLTLPTAEQAPTPNFGQDERVQIFRIEPLLDQQSRELLKEVGASFDFGMESWIVSQAGGNPGVLLIAASIPDLRKRTNSFAVDVATTFKRKIQQEVGDRAVDALCLVSLLTRVEMRGPLYDDLTILSSVFGRGLQLYDLLHEISRLELAGVVRVRGGYVEVMPSLLANHLSSVALRGRYSELAALFVALNRTARFRLIERLREVRSDEVTRFWDELFSSTGLFTDFQSALSHMQLLHSISSAVSRRVARLLEDGLSVLSLEDRRSITWDTRQNLHLILKELLFRSDTSKAALCCLLLLAAAEIDMKSNISLEAFYNCFHPFQPQCPLLLEDRLDILRWAMSAESSLEMRRIGLLAIIHGLSDGRSFVLYEWKGSEPLATPPVMTFGDIWNYWEALFDMLVAVAHSDQPELAELARSSLPDVLTQYTLFCHLTKGLARFRQVTQWCIEKQLPLSVSGLSGALLRVQNAINHRPAENPEAQEGVRNANQEINDILGYLEASDFSTRLKRWVGTWAADEHADELRALVREVIEQTQLMPEDLQVWLISEEARLGWTFFRILGESDKEQCWLPQVERLGTIKNGAIAFSAYFSGLSVLDRSFVNRRLDDLADKGVVTADAIIWATAYLTGDSAGVRRVEKLLGEGSVEIESVEFRLLRSSPWISTLSVDEYLRLLKMIAGSRLEHANKAVNSLTTWLYTHAKVEGALAEFAWYCLEKASPHGLEDAYKCDNLASKLTEADAECGFDLFEALLTQQDNSAIWNPFSLHTGHEFWPALCKADRRRALRIPLSLATKDTSLWLSITRGLLETIDQGNDGVTLIEFANENSEQARVVCACIAAKKPGFWPIALEIFRRYLGDQGIRELLLRAIIRTDVPIGAVIGIPSVDLQSRLEDVQRVLSEIVLSTSERSWLKQIESILQSEVENFREFESDRRIYNQPSVEDDPMAPERVWMLRKLLLNGQVNTLRKIISREEMISLLPNLQLTEAERARLDEQIRW